MNCLFCEIVSGNIPAQILTQTEKLMIFRDIHPQAPTHVLIIPKEHIESAKDLQEDQAYLLGEMTLMAKKISAGADFRLVMNAGLGAGQSVFHLHMHLLSGRDFSWPPG